MPLIIHWNVLTLPTGPDCRASGQAPKNHAGTNVRQWRKTTRRRHQGPYFQRTILDQDFV